VKSFGWYEDPSSIFVTMEYCRHGDLHHHIKSRRFVPAGEVQQLAYQILEGLDQMHQNDFAHRDLKPGVCMNLTLDGRILMAIEYSHQINATRQEVVDSTSRFWHK
jgi:serine/threonine protein kinase